MLIIVRVMAVATDKMDGIDIAGPYDKEFSYEVSKDEENLRMFF
jgi:hypothetical protein